MSRKVTFSQDEDACRPHGFKLVKGPGDHRQPAPFSNMIHNVLEVFSLRDPHTIDVTDEMLHDVLTTRNLKYDKRQRNQKIHDSKVILILTVRALRRPLYEIRHGKGTGRKHEQRQEGQVQIDH